MRSYLLEQHNEGTWFGKSQQIAKRCKKGVSWQTC